MSVAGLDQTGCVVPLDPTARRARVPVLDSEVREAVRAKREADIAGDSVGRSVSAARDTATEFGRSAGAVILEHEVQHARDHVGAVFGRRSVAQYLHLSKGDCWNGREVRPLAAPIDAAGPPFQGSRAVAAFTSDEDKGVVWGKSSQVRRSGQRGFIADRLTVHVEGGNHGAERVVEARIALPSDVRVADDIDWDR